MSFGQYLKETRKKKGLSSRELAKRSGISQPYISQLETGKNDNPTNEMIKKIAKGLNVSYIELLQKAGYIDEEDIEVMEDAENILKSMKPDDEQKPYKLDEILSDESLVQYKGNFLSNEDKQKIIKFIENFL